MAHFVFICSHFQMQGKLTTDCDGSVKHGKWQEPVGTLSVALTAYNSAVNLPGKQHHFKEFDVQSGFAPEIRFCLKYI